MYMRTWWMREVRENRMGNTTAFCPSSTCIDVVNCIEIIWTFVLYYVSAVKWACSWIDCTCVPVSPLLHHVHLWLTQLVLLDSLSEYSKTSVSGPSNKINLSIKDTTPEFILSTKCSSLEILLYWCNQLCLLLLPLVLHLIPARNWIRTLFL